MEQQTLHYHLQVQKSYRFESVPTETTYSSIDDFVSSMLSTFYAN